MYEINADIDREGEVAEFGLTFDFLSLAPGGSPDEDSFLLVHPLRWQH